MLTGAAVVALSATIRPEPERVAELHGTPIVMSTPAPPYDPSAPAFKPGELNDFMAAVGAGDLASMRRTYRPGMPLENTLMMAAKTGRRDAVVWLLARGASIHDDERAPYAPVLVADAFPELVSLLRADGAAEPTLENAAWANAPNAFARSLAAHPDGAKDPSALYAAAASTSGTIANKRDMLTKLLDSGADPNAILRYESPLGGAVTACGASSSSSEADDHGDCMSVVMLLLDRGARVTGDALGAALSLDARYHDVALDTLLARPIGQGVTASALVNASSVSEVDLKRLVKEQGVDWAWHDGEEDAAIPLLAAVRHGDRDLVRALIEAGAPVDTHYKDASCALADAIDNSKNDVAQARIVEVLVAHGANVNRRFPDGRTPLFAAAESGDLRVVNFLIDHGARVNDMVLDDRALDAAEENGNTPAARVIAAHGGLRGVHLSGAM